MNLVQYAVYGILAAIVALLMRVPASAFYIALCLGLISAVKNIFKGEDDATD